MFFHTSRGGGQKITLIERMMMVGEVARFFLQEDHERFTCAGFLPSIESIHLKIDVPKFGKFCMLMMRINLLSSQSDSVP